MGFFRNIILFPAVLLLWCGCSQEKTSADGKMTVVSGVPPVAFLVQEIGGSRVESVSMLPPGRTPHDFTPRTAALHRAAKARIFFSTGQTFENKAAEFLKGKSPVCNVSENIPRIHFTDGSGKHRHCSNDSCSGHSDEDPHVWLSALNAVVMAENIASALSGIDPEGREVYLENCRKLQARLREADALIRRKLSPFAGKTFFVYHPAFGYFARDYGLKQRAVELNGRETGAAGIAAVIKEAKQERASTVFVQKQFNPNTARVLAGHVGAEVADLDPLAFDLIGNLQHIAGSLEKGFAGKDSAE